MKSWQQTGKSYLLKKNARDLERILQWFSEINEVTIIDDEADYASPNGKVNAGTAHRVKDMRTLWKFSYFFIN